MLLFVADNRTKRRRQAKHKVQDFTVFAEKKENQRIHISPQLTLAMFQYLSTSRKKCFDLRKYEIYIKLCYNTLKIHLSLIYNSQLSMHLSPIQYRKLFYVVCLNKTLFIISKSSRAKKQDTIRRQLSINKEKQSIILF